MSWQIIKDLKEKRAVAFTAAGALRTTAHTANREMTGEENTRHTALLTECESFNTRIALEERSLALGEAITTNQAQQIRTAQSGENSAGMPAKDFKRYDFLRAVRCKIDGKQLDGLEGEVHAELEKRMGKKAQGFYMPTDLRVSLTPDQKRTLNIATSGVGSLEVTTESTFIDILRARTVCAKAGATYLTGLQGKIAIPRKTTTNSTFWVGEAGAVTGSNQVLDQVLFAVKTLGSFTDITRQFAHQTSLDANAFVLNDLTAAVGVALDTAALVGTGTANQPQGINGSTGVTAIALGTNGALPTFANMINMETQVAALNADMGQMSYILTPSARGYLKGAPKSGTVASGYIFDDNEVNGYPAYATSILPNNLTKGTATAICSLAIFGNFNDLVIAMWGGLDIIVDPYTGSSAGTVRIVALQDCDVELRHGQSFSTIPDMLTA